MKLHGRVFGGAALTLLISGTVVGCGQTTNSNSSDSSNQNSTTSNSGATKGTIDLAMKSEGYYFFVAEVQAAKREAQKLGYNFNVSVANMDSQTQTNQFNNYISEKPTMIISDPIDSSGLVSSIEQANRADIPVGIMDTPVDGGKVGVTVAFDNYKAGEMQAQEIVKLLTQKYGSPKGIVLNAYGALNSSAWLARKQGFDYIMKQYPNITLLDMPGQGDVSTTENVTLNALAQYGHLDAVAGPSDNPSDGIYQALKQKHDLYKVGNPKHVIFVTIDGEPMALQRIEAGYYDATVSQDAVAYGKLLIDFMVNNVLAHKPIPNGTYTNKNYAWKSAPMVQDTSGPRLDIPPYLITKSNAGDPKNWGNVAWNQYGLRYN